MSNGIYIAMNGATARTAQLDSVSDRMANVETPGFRSERPTFRSLLSSEIDGAQAHVAVEAGRVALAGGRIVGTGRALDVAPGGASVLSVAGPDGQVAFTRAGRLEVGSDGLLRAGDRPVLDVEARPIAVPVDADVVVEPDGRVTADGRPVGTLARLEIAGDAVRIGPGLVAPAPGAALVESAEPLEIGHLDMGDSDPLDATVELISAHRHFETAMSAIEVYRRLDQRAGEIGRTR